MAISLIRIILFYHSPFLFFEEERKPITPSKPNDTHVGEEGQKGVYSFNLIVGLSRVAKRELLASFG